MPGDSQERNVRGNERATKKGEKGKHGTGKGTQTVTLTRSRSHTHTERNRVSKKGKSHKIAAGQTEKTMNKMATGSFGLWVTSVNKMGQPRNRAGGGEWV